MTKNKDKTEERKPDSGKILQGILSIFALVVFCVFPVVVTDAYFNILETKYQFYSGAAIAMIVLVAVYGVVTGHILQYFKQFSLKNMLKGLSLADWSMIIFWIANVISWLICEWRWEAFWGTSGRYTGVFLVTIYLVVYFIVTRLFTWKRWYLDAFLAVSMFVCIIGITDYFKMDLLGFKAQMLPRQRHLYTSTLGNINTYTIYVATSMVISTMLFATEKKLPKIIWYYGCMMVASFALIVGVSDNAYLSLAALFGLSPLYLFKTKSGVSRYLISIATFFSVLQCIARIDLYYAGPTYRIDSAFTIIAELEFLPALVIGLWVFAGAVTFLLWKKREKDGTNELGNGLRLAWVGVIILVVGAVAFGFYDVTVAKHGKRYGELAYYLRFNDKWGTNRGFVWKRTVDLFLKELTPLQKLFGHGADTFALLWVMYFEPMESNGLMVIYDNAHNEYLNFLITIGLTGMIAYIALYVSAIAAMCKRVSKSPDVAALMMVVAAYAIQATVNINVPIVMPIIIQMLAMGLGKAPEEDEP